MGRMTQIHLIRELGAGGMGRVYEADVKFRNGRPMRMAVKVVYKDPCDKNWPVRFAREAETAMVHGHKHRNLVTTFWRGTTEAGHGYLLMELVDTSLHELLTHGPVQPAVIWRIARDVLNALDYLHRHKILHRDVSAGNILLSRDGMALLGDLGLVRRKSGSLSGQLCGTPEYTSPEVFRGLDHTAKSDVYSLGAVLYEVITGKPPYGGGGSAAIRKAIKSGKPPVRLGADTPEDLRELIHGMIACKPDERSSVAKALRHIERCGQAVADDATITELVKERASRNTDEANSDLARSELTLLGAALQPDIELVPIPQPEPEPAAPRRAWLAWALAIASLLSAVFVFWTSRPDRAPAPAAQSVSTVSQQTEHPTPEPTPSEVRETIGATPDRAAAAATRRSIMNPAGDQASPRLEAEKGRQSKRKRSQASKPESESESDFAVIPQLEP